MELLKVDSVDKAREKLLERMRDWAVACEIVALQEALGRTLARDLFAGEDIPSFRRSTVDGYAVVSRDTAAAGQGCPVFLCVKDHIEMGSAANQAILSGECAAIPTGGMLPDGTDAVVMVEYTEPFGDSGIAVYGSVANWDNVVNIGEDAREGSLLMARGRCLLPQDIGALAAAGITTVPVYVPPGMAILSTGDELVAPHQTPLPGQVRDVNTYALGALALKNGFSVQHTSVIPDDVDTLERAVRAAMDASDVVVVSGGSSKGEKDATRAVLDRVSHSGVFTHGLAIKPGKPTILAYDSVSQTLLAGLPGHPASAMMVFELLLGWLLRELTGSVPSPALPARLICNVASSPGRLTCWPVSLILKDGEYVAQPIFGKSGLISTLTRAHGYFMLDRNREGLSQGETVLVHLF